MHDGSLPTLRDVILFYDRGGVRNPHLDPQIRPLYLAHDDIDALVDFLRALNGEGFMDRAPTAFPK
jgi:cytochrome c peroxidase